MKQRGIGDRFSLGIGGWDDLKVRPPQDGKTVPEALGGASGRSLRRSGLQPDDQLVQPQLLEALPDGFQLARRELDQALALGAQLERLAQAGLVRVEPADDLLQALDGGLVGGRLGGHSSSSVLARTTPSARRASKVLASRSAAAVISGSPPSSTRSA